MKKMFVALGAAALLAGTSAIAVAQSGSPNSASQFAPGHQDRQAGDRGASGSAPGQLQNSPGDAKNYAPGQQKKSETDASSRSSKKKTK